MRFLTKEWYETMKDSGIYGIFKTDPRAATFSEELFQELYEAALQKSLSDQARWSGILKRPFDEASSRKDFEDGYRFYVKRIADRLPESILGQVADVRVLALHCATVEVKGLLDSFMDAKRKVVHNTMSEYSSFAKTQFSHLDRALFDAFSFHDERVKTAGMSGKEFVIELEDGEDGKRVRPIRFQNAKIQKQDADLCDAVWLYEELYPMENRYEVHVLFDRKGLIELILTCDDIVLE